jgi:hypothetical protein
MRPDLDLYLDRKSSDQERWRTSFIRVLGGGPDTDRSRGLTMFRGTL